MTDQQHISVVGHKVLICPLNWGLGHATRCVPLIRRLLNEQKDVTIVADGYPLAFLRQAFPQLAFIEYPSYPIHYSSGKSQIFAMLKSSPAILSGIYDEHKWLNKLLKTNHFDTVISDNRFGLFNKSVHSVYITHQLMIKMPAALKLLEPVAWLIHRSFIRKYNECWIPDTEKDENLSGDLSHKYPLPDNAKFIGWLSRYEKIRPDMEIKRYPIVVIVSGPEPQRSIFEKKMIEKFKNIPTETLLIAGKPDEAISTATVGFVTIINHLADDKFAGQLIQAEKIICRSGYSGIMDLKTLRVLHKAEFYPTPGQTEQEYLAAIQKG